MNVAASKMQRFLSARSSLILIVFMSAGCKYTCHSACRGRVSLDCQALASPVSQDHLNNNHAPQVSPRRSQMQHTQWPQGGSVVKHYRHYSLKPLGKNLKRATNTVKKLIQKCTYVIDAINITFIIAVWALACQDNLI